MDGLQNQTIEHEIIGLQDQRLWTMRQGNHKPQNQETMDQILKSKSTKERPLIK